MKPVRLVLNKAAETADLYIYEAIGADFWGEGVTPQSVADAIKTAKDAKIINVRINSPGGDVFDGQAIYNLLNTSGKRIVVHVDGLAASAASVIAMAGDDIFIAAGADLMIHRAWGMEIGFSEELRKTADLLDQLSDQISDIYAARTGLSKEEVSDLMQEETWMTAEKAVDLGFATAVTAAKKAAASVDPGRFKYKNIPERLVGMKERPRLDRMKQAIRDISV
jgi:ATP-dependent Clp protease protease subunit